jgi:hypothetical protein
MHSCDWFSRWHMQTSAVYTCRPLWRPSRPTIASSHYMTRCGVLCSCAVPCCACCADVLCCAVPCCAVCCQACDDLLEAPRFSCEAPHDLIEQLAMDLSIPLTSYLKYV